VPSDVKQIRGLPKSSVVVKNVDSIAWLRRGWDSPMVDKFKLPTLLVEGFHSRMVAGHEPQEILKSVLLWSRECAACNHLYLSRERSVRDTAALV